MVTPEYDDMIALGENRRLKAHDVRTCLRIALIIAVGKNLLPASHVTDESNRSPGPAPGDGASGNAHTVGNGKFQHPHTLGDREFLEIDRERFRAERKYRWARSRQNSCDTPGPE